MNRDSNPQTNPTESAMQRLLGHVRKYILVLLGCAYLVAVFVPEPGLWCRTPLSAFGATRATPVHFLLASLLLSLGLSTPWSKLAALTKHIKWLFVSLLIRASLFIALMIATYWMTSDLSLVALGLLLLLTMPSAASSSGWCLNFGSSQPVCLTLIAGTTLISAITVPMLLGMGAAIGPEHMRESMIALSEVYKPTFVMTWILGPMLIGIAIRSITPQVAATIRNIESPLAPLVLLLLNYANASASLPQLREQDSIQQLLPIVLACAGLFALLTIVTHAVTARATSMPAERCSVVLGTCMSNTGLALVLAAATLPDELPMHLAIIVFTIVQHLGVAILGATETNASSVAELAT